MISPFLQKLLYVNQFEIGKGKISLLGDDQIMISSSAILELQEIDKSRVYNLAKKSSRKNLSTFVEHAKVYKKIKDVFLKELSELGEKMKGSDESTMNILQGIFNIYGLGEMKIQDLNNKEKTATITLQESTLANVYLKKSGKKSEGCVCSITAGVIAGMFSYIFDKEVDCTESACKASGKEVCAFSVR